MKQSVICLFILLQCFFVGCVSSSTDDFLEYQKRYAPNSVAEIPPNKATLNHYQSLSDIQRALFLERYFSKQNSGANDGSILVQVNDQSIDDILQVYPLQILKQFPNFGTYEVLVPRFTSTDEFIASLRSNFPNLSIEKNIEIRSFEASIPSSDALQILRWNRLKNTIAKDLGPTKKKIKIGVFDTGIEDHIDLPKVMHASRDFNGHGTHVAGLIAAIQSNHVGIDGITSQVILANYPVLNNRGRGNLIDLISALMKAWREKCEILQMSIGTYEHSRILYDILTFLAQEGLIMVAAAGNDNSSDPALPAMHPMVIGVGSHNSQRLPSSFSNKGINVIVSLPGENIISTLPNNKFGPMSGTSMSAPLLSGILSEILSRRKSPISVIDLLNLFAKHAADVNSDGKSLHFPFDGFLFLELYKPLHR